MEEKVIMEDDAIEVRKLWKLQIQYTSMFGGTKEFLYSTRDKAVKAFEKKIASELILNWLSAFKDVGSFYNRINSGIPIDNEFLMAEVKKGWNFRRFPDFFAFGISNSNICETISISETELKIY